MSERIIHVGAEGWCESCGRPFRLVAERPLGLWERRLCEQCFRQAWNTWVSTYAGDSELCEHVTGADLADELVMEGWQLQEGTGLVLATLRCRSCGATWPGHEPQQEPDEPWPGATRLPAPIVRSFLIAVAVAVLALATLLSIGPFGWFR